MAQRQLELSCARFRKDLNAEDDRTIREASLDDVRATIAQTERELASRRGLRNFDRLSPYINAIERFGKVIDVFGNSSPFVPYIWGPLKFILLAVKEQTRALDQILGAYAMIGNALPRLSALQVAYKHDHDFQMLFAFLYHDITEFHRRVYQLIRKPAWPIFFSSAWGRFERRFEGLIINIAKTSDLIDKQATTRHILEVREWRQKSMEDSKALEIQVMSEQRQTVLNWLGVEIQHQEKKLDWLNARRYEGTLNWIADHRKIRSWLQRGRGNPVLWIHGKPGSGKSVLVSQVVSDPKKKGLVLYFFCDYRTPAYQVTTQIFNAFLAQCISQDPDLVPFLYNDYVSEGLSPIAKVLKPALIAVFKSADMVRLIVDGLDEIEATEHNPVLRELRSLTESSAESCKLLVASQDIPSIRSVLSKASQIFLGDEKQSIAKDMQVVVDARLTELDEGLNGALGGAERAKLQASIVDHAEGMFLWINLILTLLREAGSIEELESTVNSLPKDLEQMYGRLLDRIRSRCHGTPGLSRVFRIFEWLLFAERKGHMLKQDVLTGSSIHEDCTILNRKSMPFPTALDICKPLIEDGPGGTVAFIHSTLPWFLVKSRNGPLLSPHIGHKHIAFACVSHLIQVLKLLEPEFPREKKIESVGRGCLGLQGYANQHWISHILNYVVEASDVELNSEVPLIQQLLHLTAGHDNLLQKVKPHIDGDDRINASTPVLEKLNAFLGIRDLIRRVLSFQDSFSAQQLAEGADVLAVDSDTTLFSLADSTYQALVELLLETYSSPGLTEADLIAFKSQFGATAFACPFKGCVRGFASAAELHDHKTHRHKQRLKCYEEKCVHNDVGFASAGSFQQHMKKVHRKESQRIPITLKRREKVEDQELLLPRLADLDIKRLSPRYKKVEKNWYVIYNPDLPRLLDLDLVHTLVHQEAPSCVRFSKDGKYVATGSEKSAQIYHVKSGMKRCDLRHDYRGSPYAHIRPVCFSPDGKYLATGNEDGTVLIWNIAYRFISKELSGHGDDARSGYGRAVNCLDFSPDGRIIASGGSDHTIRLWNVESSSNIMTLRVKNFVTGVAISHDGQLVTAVSVDKSVWVWNLQGDQIGHDESPYEQKDSVYSVAFSPNGKRLVTGSSDNTAKLWEIDSSGDVSVKQALTCSKTFEGHKDFVKSVAMTPDACWVLSASHDRGVQFWDASTGDCQLRVQGHENYIEYVSVSPTGTYFATASEDRLVRIWKYTDLGV